jgi:hypothetical protein
MALSRLGGSVPRSPADTTYNGLFKSGEILYYHWSHSENKAHTFTHSLGGESLSDTRWSCAWSKAGIERINRLTEQVKNKALSFTLHEIVELVLYFLSFISQCISNRGISQSRYARGSEVVGHAENTIDPGKKIARIRSKVISP